MWQEATLLATSDIECLPSLNKKKNNQNTQITIQFKGLCALKFPSALVKDGKGQRKQMGPPPGTWSMLYHQRLGRCSL